VEERTQEKTKMGGNNNKKFIDTEAQADELRLTVQTTLFLMTTTGTCETTPGLLSATTWISFWNRNRAL
jgi:hypothetical protein